MNYYTAIKRGDQTKIIRSLAKPTTFGPNVRVFGPQEEPPTEQEMDAAFAVPPTEKPRVLSKLFIRRKLREMGKETAFDTMLDTLPGARADWNDAQSLMTNDPMFVEYRETVQAMLGVTNEQWDYLME